VTVRGQAGDRRPRPTARAAVLLIAVTVLGVLLTVPARQYLSERGRIDALKRQAERLQAANAALQLQITRLHDPAELEQLARECLGMVKEGEIAFVIGSRAGDTGPSDC
jgi:cell division protein FtsL